MRDYYGWRARIGLIYPRRVLRDGARALRDGAGGCIDSHRETHARRCDHERAFQHDGRRRPGAGGEPAGPGALARHHVRRHQRVLSRGHRLRPKGLREDRRAGSGHSQFDHLDGGASGPAGARSEERELRRTLPGRDHRTGSDLLRCERIRRDGRPRHGGSATIPHSKSCRSNGCTPSLARGQSLTQTRSSSVAPESGPSAQSRASRRTLACRWSPRTRRLSGMRCASRASGIA